MLFTWVGVGVRVTVRVGARVRVRAKVRARVRVRVRVSMLFTAAVTLAGVPSTSRAGSKLPCRQTPGSCVRTVARSALASSVSTS